MLKSLWHIVILFPEMVRYFLTRPKGDFVDFLAKRISDVHANSARKKSMLIFIGRIGMHRRDPMLISMSLEHMVSELNWSDASHHACSLSVESAIWLAKERLTSDILKALTSCHSASHFSHQDIRHWRQLARWRFEYGFSERPPDELDLEAQISLPVLKKFIEAVRASENSELELALTKFALIADDPSGITIKENAGAIADQVGRVRRRLSG